MSNDPSDQYSALAVASSSEDEARQAALKFIENCGIAMVSSNGPDGYPLTKAMLKAESEELHTVWFSTNTSSARVAQFRADSRASIYFVDMSEYRGLLLVGTMEVLSDHASRERLWRYGNELYYPAGIDDPDYSVLKFTARRGNYYHGLRNTDFAV